MTERSIPDRLGEALRVHRYGLIRPLWPDLDDANKEAWRAVAGRFIGIMRRRGLKVVEGDADATD